LSLVENLCTDLLILRRGQAVFCGPVQEARERFGALGQESLEDVFFRAIEGQEAASRET
jgi:ABC-2 type transport system ATP-binding protein